MFKISCFADEISSSLEEQIAVMKRNRIGHVELRSVWDRNVLDLEDREVASIKTQLENSGIKVSSIGSPIGKVDIHSDFSTHLGKFQRAVEIALRLEAPYIRIFSFYMKKDELDACKDKVIERIKSMLHIARREGIVLLHENEADIYGETSARCESLFKAVADSSFKAVFDPSNFVAAGEEPYDESFARLKEHVEYMHIKDSLRQTREIVIAGLGDGRIKDILYALKDKESMFLSLEPHLAYAGIYKGFSGPDLFEKDLAALKKLLDEIDAEYL